MSRREPTVAEIDVYATDFVFYGDKSRAWRLAFPDSKAKPNTVNVMACEFHKLEQVQERIKELSEKARKIADKEFDLTAQYVANRLKQVDELDVIDIMTDDLKQLKPLSQWPKEWRTSISGIDFATTRLDEDVESYVHKIKWPDKAKNLEMIGKLASVGAFTENVNINAGETVTPWTALKAGIDERS